MADKIGQMTNALKNGIRFVGGKPKRNAKFKKPTSSASTRGSLRVPSTLTQSEFNFLLNPSHPEFSKIRIGSPRPYKFDPRLLKPK